MFSLIRALWLERPEDAYLTLVGKLPRQRKPKEIDHAELACLDEFGENEEEAIRGWSAKYEVYFGLGARAADILPSQAGKIDQIVALPAFAIDIDICAPGAHKKEDLPKDLDDVVLLFESARVPAPTFVVFTGYGYHCYYAFDRPLFLGSIGERRQAQALYASFHARFKKAAEKHGWRFDDAYGIQRIWRLPTTLNHKRDESKIVEIEYLDGDRYTLADLGLRAPVKGTDRYEENEISSDALSDRDFEILKRLRARLRQVPETDKYYEAIQRLLQGESFADAERHYALLHITAKISWYPEARDASPRTLARIFEASVRTWQEDDSREHLPFEEEMGKIAGLIRDGQRKFLLRQEEKRERFAGIQKVFQNFAEDELPSVEVLQQHSILVKAPSYFVFDFQKGEYGFPVSKDELQTYCRDAWKEAEGDLQLTYPAKKGEGVVHKLPSQLSREYGTVVKKVIGNLAAQESSYDPEEGVFAIALCPRRELTPRYDKTIEDWLDVLAGPGDRERLHAWIASIGQLDKPTCILYLEGESDCGKSLLARGLARIWTRNNPADFEHCIGADFNEEMARCPLIWLDEGLDDKRNVSSKIRALIGGAGFTLNAKYRSTMQVCGCHRMIVTANNENALRFTESNSKQDIEAIAKRILHILIRPEAADWLRERGGRAFVEPWISRDYLARHALWLEQNYEFEPGARFLVEGEETDYHRNLRTHSDADAQLCEFLVRYASNPCQIDLLTRQKGYGDPGISIGNGQFLATAQGYLDHHETYMPGRAKPVSGRAVGQALHKLSLQRIEMRLAKHRYWHELDFSYLVNWSKKTTIGDVRLMEKNFRRVIEEEEGVQA